MAPLSYAELGLGVPGSAEPQLGERFQNGVNATLSKARPNQYVPHGTHPPPYPSQSVIAFEVADSSGVGSPVRSIPDGWSFTPPRPFLRDADDRPERRLRPRYLLASLR